MEINWQEVLGGLNRFLGQAPNQDLAAMGASMDENPAALVDPASGMVAAQQNAPAIAQVGGWGGINNSSANNWLNMLMQMQQVMGATQAGNQQQELMKKIAAMQMMAAQRAMAFNPARLAQNAIRDTLPISRQLAYQVGQAEDANLAAKGMFQSPGATAAGQAAALAPYAQQNQEMGQRMALAGAQMSQNGLQTPFYLSSPDYLSTLNELNTLGQNSAFPGSR